MVKTQPFNISFANQTQQAQHSIFCIFYPEYQAETIPENKD